MLEPLITLFHFFLQRSDFRSAKAVLSAVEPTILNKNHLQDNMHLESLVDAYRLLWQLKRLDSSDLDQNCMDLSSYFIEEFISRPRAHSSNQKLTVTAM